MGLQIQVLRAITAPRSTAAFGAFVREPPEALFVTSDPFFTNRRVQLVRPGDALRGPHCICRAGNIQRLAG